MNTVQYKCPNCGGELKFDPGKQQFGCEYCRSLFSEAEIKQVCKENEETDLSRSPEELQQEQEFAEHSNLYECGSCGAQVVADDNTAAAFCYYCHNPVILKGRLSGEYKPGKVLPFKITKEEALHIFSGWCKKRWFLPRAFKEKQNLEKITGLYVPFWVADCNVHADLNAIGKLNPRCTGAVEAPVSKTAEELKSQEFLTELKEYFTQELTYTVWAADSENTNNGYPVITGVAEKKDYHKQLTAFKVGKLNMTIDEAAGTITGMIPYDVDMAAVTPTITISANASVSPASGEATDFSKGAVTYTVTAEDGTTKTYQVTLTKPASGKGLMTFQIEGDYTGTTGEKKLLLTAADFKQDTLTYDIDCRDGVIDTQLNVWAIPAVQNATVQVAINENDPVNVTVANDLVSSGKFVRCFDLLHQGKNTLVFTVPPPEGSEVAATTYTVKLNLRPSLHEKSVTATGVTVEPGGYIYETQSITEYTLTMTPTTQSVNVSFTAYGEPGSTIVTGPVEFTGTVKHANSKLYAYAADVPVDRTMESFTI